ncbi:endo-1,4-beta-xylanase [Gracilimonas mengyeensis]|uniref:Beta-xylanase n=1 Tax=Gracilimonas mengyeensis TaxID=1302730 RepID=A0A521B606_9BACT|nr:endo-1,4-beta-xylanase [Gracilimonas mengyeensis]SMO42519.1 Endo-1,4-beta-xylanase, GH35 family [Gracilimonas mengyeensis]
MKTTRLTSIFSLAVKALLFICFTLLLAVPVRAQNQEVLEKITPEAINQRIEQHRMGSLIIHTAPGAEVTIEQQSHEFLFGAALPNHLAENSENPMTSEEREQFLSILSDNFNYAVHENALKWYDTEKTQGEVNYAVADRIYELMDSLNIPMRGHTVFWAKEEFNTEWLTKLTNDELRKAIADRAESLINHFEGRINEYDLNNEMVHGSFFRDRLGYGIISEMAWMVKAHNPDAKLYTNDYGILDVGHNAGPYANQIRKMLANGVPLDGIGMQAHRSVSVPYENTPYMVQRNLDRFLEFDLPIKITEALFAQDTDEERAAELKKLFPIYFAHPRVEAILIWGIWEKPHWIPESAMWKTDFSPTLQSKAYQDLVFDEWWTNTTTRANDDGLSEIKAFYGDYAITVDGKTKVVSLKKEDGKSEVRF